MNKDMIFITLIAIYYFWLVLMFDPQKWHVRKRWHMLLFMIPFYAIVKRAIDRISYLYSRYKKLK